MRRLAAGILALAALGAGCGEEGPEVRVFAASSLTDVLGTLAADFEKETGTKVRLNLGSSSILAKQIVEGARCDLFLSADEEWAAFVRGNGAGGIPPAEVILTNRLVVVMAAGRWFNPMEDFARMRWRPDQIREMPSEPSPKWARMGGSADNLGFFLTSPSFPRIAVGDPEHVPAGRYARMALEYMELWDACKDRLVPCESVRAALALVEMGEADAGIVYRTDAMSGNLRMVTHCPDFIAHQLEMGVESSEGTLVPAEFPGVEPRVLAVLPAGDRAPGTRFLAFLKTERASAVFTKAGFLVPGRSR